MGLYRDETGLVFETDDVFAKAHGFTPVSPEEETQMLGQQAIDDRAKNRGVVGDINAGATGLASGLTLGASDFLLGEGMTDEERQRLLGDIKQHPILRTGGEVVGSFAAGLAEPGSGLAKTPTGYLSSLAGREMEQGLLEGGVRGTAKALTAMGAEGAANSVGQYIGQSALQDTDITAEGLGGALGAGFEFGTVGGGAALGITKGAIAARRLYSRVMDGADAAKTAESMWSKTQQEMLDADTLTADVAKKRLDEIAKMKEEALRYRQEAKASVQEERIRAQRAAEQQAPAPSDFEANVPTNVIKPDELMTPAQGGMPTSVFERPAAVEFNPGDAARFDATLPTPGEGPEPLVPSDFAKPESGAVTALKSPKAAAGEATDLEKQLASTKAELDQGKSLQDLGGEKAVPGSAVSPQIPPGKTPPKYEGRNPSNEIERMLAEKAGTGATDAERAAMRERMKPGEVPKAKMQPHEYGAVNKPVYPDFGEQYGFPKRQPFANLRQQLNKNFASMTEMRRAATTELLGEKVASEEDRLNEVLNTFEKAKADLMDQVVANQAPTEPFAGVPSDFLRNSDVRAQKTVANKKTIEQIERAHEAALAQVDKAYTPSERAAALHAADDLEAMLGKINTGDMVQDIGKHVDVIQRYEKASADLAEALGDGAHPVSKQYADMFGEANEIAVKKAQDRSARAVEDAEQFGAEQKSPKERVLYAKERHLDAQREYDRVSAESRSAKKDYNAAQQKVAEGERAKKAALKEDARNAKSAAKAASYYDKVTGIGGLLEIANVPGLPKASDLPVIGPLLGAYLKYRTLKAAMGRLGGKIPATGNARVAALAARTKDRVAIAVDRSIGAVTKAGKVGTKALPNVAGVLAKRVYNDGLPDAKPGANVQELAGVRMREIAAYVTTPGAIEADVRKALVDVSDPDVIAAAEKQRRAAFEYLMSTMPKLPERSPLEKQNIVPSPTVAISFARRMEAFDDPAGVMERIAEQQNAMTLEAAETLRNVYPQTLALAQQRVLQRAAEMQNPVPYPQRLKLSLLYQVPLDSSLQPDTFRITQSVFIKAPEQPPQQPAVPPSPSVAQPTNLTALYQTAADRRASR